MTILHLIAGFLGSITMRSAILLVLSWAVSPGYAAGVRNLAGIGINCGKPGGGPDSEYFRQSRIMGGTAAKIIEFPYAVSLKDDAGEHFCGGSLVMFSHLSGSENAKSATFKNQNKQSSFFAQ